MFKMTYDPNKYHIIHQVWIWKMGNSYLLGSRAFLHQRIHQGQPPLVSDLKVHQHKDFPFRCCYCVPKQDVNQTLVILKSNYFKTLIYIYVCIKCTCITSMSFVWTSRFTTKDLVYEFSRSDKVALTVTFPFIGKNLLIWLDKYTLLNDVRAIALSIYNMYILNESRKKPWFQRGMSRFVDQRFLANWNILR